MTNDKTIRPGVFAVVLAAGESRRFGRLKQLAVIGGETLVHNAARVARESCGVNTAIVLGHQAWDVLVGADGQCQFVLINDRYKNGIGASIALCAHTIGSVADALLLLLADQPLVTPEHLRAIIAAWSGDDTHIVASSYENISGPPILLPRATFASLRQLTGDNGARAILSDRRFSVTRIPIGNAGIDIDTPNDLISLGQAAE